MSLRRRRSSAALGLLVVTLSLVACETPRQVAVARPEEFPPLPGSGGPTTVGPTSPCPGFDPPNEGASCVDSWNGTNIEWSGLCEYGHDLDRSCNDVFECAQLWQRQPRNECFGRCPPTFAEISPGAACGDVAVGCSYIEGTCACAPDPDEVDDAGVGVAGRWRCAPPPGNGCPAQRPSIGSDCVRPMTCDYGACALRRELVYSCPETGTWIQGDSPEVCP